MVILIAYIFVVNQVYATNIAIHCTPIILYLFHNVYNDIKCQLKKKVVYIKHPILKITLSSA